MRSVRTFDLFRTRTMITLLLGFGRLSALGTQSSASYSLRRSGMGLITRKHKLGHHWA